VTIPSPATAPPRSNPLKPGEPSIPPLAGRARVAGLAAVVVFALVGCLVSRCPLDAVNGVHTTRPAWLSCAHQPAPVRT
jgi:hypothetical protein